MYICVAIWEQWVCSLLLVWAFEAVPFSPSSSAMQSQRHYRKKKNGKEKKSVDP